MTKVAYVKRSSFVVDQQEVSVMHAFSSFKPVFNWANVCSDTSTNYDSFLN